MTKDTQDIAATLAAKRAEIEAQLVELTRPAEELGSISFGKRIGEGTSQAVERLSAVSAHDQLRVTLSEVERAQAKLAEGSYGDCDVCGRPIGQGRLEVRPWSSRCVEHA